MFSSSENTVEAIWPFDHPDDEKVSTRPTTADGFTLGNKPGMSMRLMKESLQMFKNAMENWYPHYINYDAHLPKNVHFDYSLIFDIFNWHFRYNNLTYDIADFDLRDAGVELITVNDHYRNIDECDVSMWGEVRCKDKYLIDLQLPIIERWKIDAQQDIEGDIQTMTFKRIEEFFDDKAPVTILLENIDFSFRTDLMVDWHGYLELDIWSCNFNFGSSEVIHHDDKWSFFVDQAINLLLVVTERSCGVAGEYMFRNTLAPVLDEYMNHYKMQIAFPSLIRGQGTWDIFEIDYRNTLRPLLEEDNIDIFMDGGLIYNGTGCTLNPSLQDFHEGFEDFSQLLITEDAASCWVNQIARSQIGKVHLDHDSVNAFYDTYGM